jgi:hypothetical protein
MGNPLTGTGRKPLGASIHIIKRESLSKYLAAIPKLHSTIGETYVVINARLGNWIENNH